MFYLTSLLESKKSLCPTLEGLHKPKVEKGFMLKKIISYLVIFALLYVDMAFAMRKGSEQNPDLDENRTITQPLLPKNKTDLRGKTPDFKANHSLDSEKSGGTNSGSLSSSSEEDPESHSPKQSGGSSSSLNSENSPPRSKDETPLSKQEIESLFSKQKKNEGSRSSVIEGLTSSKTKEAKRQSLNEKTALLTKNGGNIQDSNDGMSLENFANFYGSANPNPTFPKGSIPNEKNSKGLDSGEKEKSLGTPSPSSSKSGVTSPLLEKTGKATSVNSFQGDLVPFGQGGDRDPEKGTSVTLPKLPDDIDPGVLAFLLYAKNYINDGKFTLKQGLIGGFGGTLIGVGVGNGMTAIFLDGMSSLGGNKFNEVMKDVAISNAFITHTAVSLGFDSVFRNVMIIGDLVGPSMEEFSIPAYKIKIKQITIDPRKCALVLAYAGAGVAASLPVYYLWKIEQEDIKWDEENNSPQTKNRYLTFFYCLAFPLWLDSLFANGRAVKKWVDQKFKESLIAKTYVGAHLSNINNIRLKKLSLFKDLHFLFKILPDDDINNIYERVLTKGLDIKSNGSHIPDDMIKATEALQTLKVLDGIYQEYEIPVDIKKYWKKTTAEVLGWIIPGLATVGRSYVFYYIIQELLNGIGLPYGVANTVLSAIFGGAIASTFQGKVEKDAVEEGVYDLLQGEEAEGATSHNCIRNTARKIGKGYDYIQGAWNTLPYILVGIAATSDWPTALQVLTLFFFGLADMFSNTMAFHESYGGAIQGAESLISYKYASPTYKRNKLRRLVQRYSKAFETMSPEVLMKVNGLVSVKGNN